MGVDARFLNRPLNAERNDRSPVKLKSARKDTQRDIDGVILGSGSPRRFAAISHILQRQPGYPPIKIDVQYGGPEEERDTPPQIAGKKASNALTMARQKRYVGNDEISLGTDVKNGAGHDLLSKLEGHDQVQDVLRNIVTLAKQDGTYPYYLPYAATTIQRFHEEPKTYHWTETVKLELDKIEQIANNPEHYSMYEEAVAYTEILPDRQGQTKLLDISSGLSLAALVYMDAVKSITIKGEEIPRYTEDAKGNHIPNPSFELAFKNVYFLQAVGFPFQGIDSDIFNKTKGLKYKSTEEAVHNWDWINEIKRRAFKEPLVDVPSPALLSRRS